MICIQLCFPTRPPETSMHVVLPNHPGCRVSYRCIQPTETLRWSNPDRACLSTLTWTNALKGCLSCFIERKSWFQFCGFESRRCGFVLLTYPPDFCCHPSAVMVITVVKICLCKFKKSQPACLLRKSSYHSLYIIFICTVFCQKSSSNSLMQICLITEAVWFLYYLIITTPITCSFSASSVSPPTIYILFQEKLIVYLLLYI